MQAQTATPIAPHVHWRVRHGARLKFRYWDGECVLYHGATGDTHRVPEPVGQVLEALTSSLSSIDDLSVTVDLHAADVAEILDAMRELGIVERVA